MVRESVENDWMSIPVQGVIVARVQVTSSQPSISDEAVFMF